MDKVKNMKGKKINRWTVLRRNGSAGTQKQAAWECVCECGTIRTITGASLRKGKSRSCGCLKRELRIKRNTTHGMTGTRFYRAWKNMKTRCLKINNRAYHRYGGRGIKICDQWHEFKNFMEDMLPSYKEPLELDRIDNDGDYYKKNCRWVTKIEQSNNTSRNINLTFMGKTKTLSQWSREKNINVNTLWCRLYKHKWSLEDSLTKPVRRMSPCLRHEMETIQIKCS